MKENFIGIGKRIKSALDSKGLKQIDACKKANISKNAISNYINGNRVPDTTSLYKLSKLLNVSMEWLLTGDILSDNNVSEDLVNSSDNNFIICENIQESDHIKLSKDEHDLIYKYRELSRDDKEEIFLIINMKHSRLFLKKAKSSSSTNGKDDKELA